MPKIHPLALCKTKIHPLTLCMPKIHPFKSTQCQGAYALKKSYSQELSSRIGEETKFEVLRLEGEIAENVMPLDTAHPKNSLLGTAHL
jgi:hypothetical protein